MDILNHAFYNLGVIISFSFILFNRPSLKKVSLRKKIFFIVFHFAIVMSFIYINYILKLILITSLLILILILLKIEKYEAILSIVITTIIYILSFLISCVILMELKKIDLYEIQNNYFYTLLLHIFNIIIGCFIVQFIEKIFLLNNTNLYNKKRIVYNTISCLTTFGIILFNLYDYMYFHKQKNVKLFLLYILLIVLYSLTNISMICLVDKYTNEKLKNKYKEEELSQLLDYTRNMENIMQEMRKNAHNHTNIMSTINGYLELNKIDELKQYFFEEINPEYNSLSLVNNNSASLKNLSNFPALKGILSYKLIISQQKELEIHIDIFENIAKIHMDTLDKCKILGILIDNAIEAAEDTDMKKVNIAVFKGENYVSFIIENSYKERPDIRKIFEKGYSTKGINRGLGLSMVRQIINDRYPNVLLNTLIKNDMFTQELHIYEKDT